MRSPIRTDEITAILGMPGSGKTELAVWIVKQLSAAGFQNWRIWDHTGDFRRRLGNDRRIQGPTGQDPTAWRRQFNAWCRDLLRHGNTLIIVDEADIYGPNISIPLFEIENASFFGEIAHRGVGMHHQGLGLVVITRRPASMHKDLLSFSKNILLFKLDDEADAKAVKGYVGKANIERMKDLEDHGFFWINKREKGERRVTPMPPLEL